MWKGPCFHRATIETNAARIAQQPKTEQQYMSLVHVVSGLAFREFNMQTYSVTRQLFHQLVDE
jgi:hypothetical protein